MYVCEILADSVRRYADGSTGPRLTTFRITYPRFILAQFNTHRALSRSTASSRAIPSNALIDAVRKHPYTPVCFPRNQSGMFPKGDPLSDAEARHARDYWKAAVRACTSYAELLADMGVHKEITNRLLEPFLWITTIVSATEWDNFFALRTDSHAQSEFRTIASLMRARLQESLPKVLGIGDWHLPLVDSTALRSDGFTNSAIRRISAGRCARVSFLPRDIQDPREDLALAERLIRDGHMSPLEHVARPFEEGRSPRQFCGNYRGWVQLRKTILGEAVFRPKPPVP